MPSAMARWRISQSFRPSGVCGWNSGGAGGETERLEIFEGLLNRTLGRGFQDFEEFCFEG
jgi:hypothetical protein